MTIEEELESAVETCPGRENLCGVIRISRDRRVLFERAYGYASVQLGVLNQSNTRFHIASMTKMFIAAATVRLATEGVISLQAPPSRYLPALSAIDSRITIHHLLSHTSGLFDVYEKPGLRVEILQVVARGGSLLDYLLLLPQLSAPGEKWSYSTTGFLLLAYVLEAVTGSAFDVSVREMFLAPLGMHNTGPDDPYRVNPGRAMGQIQTNSGWRNAPNDLLADIEGPREFYSTVADLDLWGTALLEGKVLNEAASRLMFSPQARIGPESGFDPSMSYGYGWFLGDRFRMIGGMTPGFRATMWQFPDERINLIVLGNSEQVESHRLFRKLRPILSR